jgi:hypothetical protein
VTAGARLLAGAGQADVEEQLLPYLSGQAQGRGGIGWRAGAGRNGGGATSASATGLGNRGRAFAATGIQAGQYGACTQGKGDAPDDGLLVQNNSR